MADPVAGLREMARVTRDGGVAAACVWDHSGDRGPLSLFWRAAHDLDPEVVDESRLMGAQEGDLRRIMRPPGCTGSKNASCPSASRARPSRSGGSRSPSASGRREATWQASTRTAGSSCANTAVRCCRRRPSRSRRSPGRHGASRSAIASEVAPRLARWDRRRAERDCSRASRQRLAASRTRRAGSATFGGVVCSGCSAPASSWTSGPDPRRAERPTRSTTGCRSGSCARC